MALPADPAVSAALAAGWLALAAHHRSVLAVVRASAGPASPGAPVVARAVECRALHAECLAAARAALALAPPPAALSF